VCIAQCVPPWLKTGGRSDLMFGKQFLVRQQTRSCGCPWRSSAGPRNCWLNQWPCEKRAAVGAFGALMFFGILLRSTRSPWRYRGLQREGAAPLRGEVQKMRIDAHVV